MCNTETRYFRVKGVVGCDIMLTMIAVHRRMIGTPTRESFTLGPT